MPGLKELVSSIRPGKERDAGPDLTAIPLHGYPASVFSIPKGKLHKRNKSSVVLNSYSIGNSVSKSQPTQYCDQGYNLGSVLLASLSKRPSKPSKVLEQVDCKFDVVSGRDDNAASDQIFDRPRVERHRDPAHVPDINRDLNDKEAIHSGGANLVDTGLISFAEIQRGKGSYMTADGSIIDQHELQYSQDLADGDRVPYYTRKMSLTKDANSITEQSDPGSLPNSGRRATIHHTVGISRPSSASTFYSFVSLSEDAAISQQLHAGLELGGVADHHINRKSVPSHQPSQPSAEPYSQRTLPAIRDLDWSTLDPADFERIAHAYNDTSPMDSAVALPEQASMPVRTYHGKGKGRATDGLWHDGLPIVFAPRPQLRIPPVPRDHPLVARDHHLELERQHAEARRLQEVEDRVHAEKIQAEMVREEEEVCMRMEQEAARLLEQQRLEEEARLAEEAARSQECNVCGDSKPRLDFPVRAPSQTCTHNATTCVECLAMWMTSELETKGSDGLKCPECPSILQYDEVQRAASPSTFEAYEKLLTRSALAALDDFAWCLNAECGSGQENPQNNNYMDCAACGYKQCLTHKCVWHSNETCAQYEYRTSGQAARDEEAKTEAMLDGLSKKCPGPACGWRIEKISGCDHMRCKRCKYEFCWQCLASHAKIKTEGNTAHEKWCAFHSDKLDLAWPFNAH